jgi:hypothetical protein
MDSRGLITEANRKWWTLGAMFTDALGSAMALGAGLTAITAVVAAVVISGKPRHEVAAHAAARAPSRGCVTHLTDRCRLEKVALV